MKLTLQTVTSHCRRVCVVRHDHGMTTPAARTALAPVWRLAAARGPAPQAEISGGALDSAPFWHGAVRRHRDLWFTRIITAAGAIPPPSPRQQQSLGSPCLRCAQRVRRACQEGTCTLPHCQSARVMRLAPLLATPPSPSCARAWVCTTVGEDLLGGLCAQLGVQQDGGGLLPGVRAQGLAVKPAPLIGVQCALRVPLACTAGGQRVPGRGACHAARESLLGLNCRCRSAARAAWATGCGASGSR